MQEFNDMYIDGTFLPFILSLLILPLSNVMLFINTLYEIYMILYGKFLMIVNNAFKDFLKKLFDFKSEFKFT